MALSPFDLNLLAGYPEPQGHTLTKEAIRAIWVPGGNPAKKFPQKSSLSFCPRLYVAAAMEKAVMGPEVMGTMVQQALNSRFICPSATSITRPHRRRGSGEEMRHALKPMQQETSAPSRQNGDFLLHCLSSPTTEKKIQKKKKKSSRSFWNFLILLRALIN